VTGVSSGIGLETARALMARGISVVGAARDLGKTCSTAAPVRNAASRGRGELDLIELDVAALSSARAPAADCSRTVVASKSIRAPITSGICLDNSGEPLLVGHGRLVVLSSQARGIANVASGPPRWCGGTA
jgi:NAD(P)-dependent dehydrogenase (short-subunit alcohol dehydrogenase family)